MQEGHWSRDCPTGVRSYSKFDPNDPMPAKGSYADANPYDAVRPPAARDRSNDTCYKCGQPVRACNLPPVFPMMLLLSDHFSAQNGHLPECHKEKSGPAISVELQVVHVDVDILMPRLLCLPAWPVLSIHTTSAAAEYKIFGGGAVLIQSHASLSICFHLSSRLQDSCRKAVDD